MRPVETPLGYLFLGVGWLALAGINFGSHRAAAIADIEVATGLWLNAILLKLGMKRKTQILIAVAFMAGAVGIDRAVGIF